MLAVDGENDPDVIGINAGESYGMLSKKCASLRELEWWTSNMTLYIVLTTFVSPRVRQKHPNPGIWGFFFHGVAGSFWKFKFSYSENYTILV